MTSWLSVRRHLAAIAIDAVTIPSVAVVLAALYCGSRIAPTPGRALVFPRLPSFEFAIPSPHYFPWTDVAGNVFLGFALAHGWPIVEAGTGNHMPGVPQYLGAWMWLFGLGDAAPSAQTAAAAYLVACFATLLFEAVCVYVPLRLLGFSASVAGLTSLAVCASTAFAYDFAMPMSETLITYLLIAVPLLAARMLLAEDPRERLLAAVVLAGPLTLACVLLGLTVAFANVLIALACLALVVAELASEPKYWRALVRDRRAWAAVAVTLALVLATLLTTRVSTLYFWAVETNAARGLAALMQPWARSFAPHLANSLGLADPLGSRYPHLLLGLAAFCGISLLAAHRRELRPRTAVRLALFVALMIAIAVLTQWREVVGYKSATLLGLTLGTAFLTLAYLPPRWRTRPLLWLAPVWLAALCQTMFFRDAIAYNTASPVRAAALEAANVCRLDQVRDCRCVQLTVYGPQLFLLNDMRPCPNRNLTFDANAGVVPVTRQWILDDARDPTMVFWTFGPDALMVENGVPPELVRYWRTQARCASIDADNALCFPP